MAMDIHDSLGQISAGLRLLLHNHRKVIGQKLEEDYVRTVDTAISLPNSLTGEVRNIAASLYPVTLETDGVDSAIRKHVDHLSGLTDIYIEISSSGPRRLSRDLELHLFRIVQECLTNILKHSSADHAWISLDHSDAEVVLSVHDDGRGMPQNLVENFNKGQGPLGFGLSGFLERVRDQGGSAWIRTSAHGTEVTVSMPLEEKIRSTGEVHRDDK